jgi:hypothetical protein
MNFKKFNLILLSVFVIFTSIFTLATFFSVANIPASAQYGSFEQCENFTDPVKREECNARIQARVNRRINRLTTRAQNQIIRAITRGSDNLNALIQSILNVLYWEIWNVINVIFPIS